MIAEIAFLSRVIDRVEESDTVRTPHDTVATANAPRPVNHDDTVRCLIRSPHWAYLNTRRILALIA